MMATQLRIYMVLIGAIVVAIGFFVSPKLITDAPSFFSRTADYQQLTSNQHGFSFLVPRDDVLRVESWPNPDGLAEEYWAEARFPGQPQTRRTVGGFSLLAIGENETRYIVDNSVNMLELTLNELSDEERDDILQSWSVVLRTLPVELDLVGIASAFNNMLYSNARAGNMISITGDEAADDIIRSIGEARGYQIRGIVDDESKLVLVDGYPARQKVADAWQKLDEAALVAGFDLMVVSGYRNTDEQVEIFKSEFANEAFRLFGAGLTFDDIDSVQGRAVVTEVLKTVAAPGYSKHHTGWTLDITEAGINLFDFATAPANKWLSANNFANARRFGFLPSYPKGGPNQGPEPEAWEYVYVGEEFLGYN